MKKNILLFILTIILFSCKEKEQKNIQSDTLTSGTITISVDESFKPIIEEQLEVFHASYPDAHINVKYKTEADCINDLDDESIRMIIVTRELSQDEADSFQSAGQYIPRYRALAKDGVAVIMNKSNPDSLLTLGNIKDLLSKKGFKNHEPVFDGTGETSNYRFAVDSILKNQPMTSKVRGAKNNLAVIDYVANTPNAIGFVGVNWIGNYGDIEQNLLRDKITIASVQCIKCKETGKVAYLKPTQYNFATREYPLTRMLYAIVKETDSGLGSGFINFLTLERGQLIFRRAGMMPVQMPFIIRNVILNEK